METSDCISAKDKERSFVVFKYTTTNITPTERNVFYYSPTFRVQQMNWAIAYKVHRPMDHNEDVFGVFIAFKDTANISYPMINMEVELKLVNHVNYRKSISKDFAAFFNTSARTHLGFKKFMYWHDVVTRNMGFSKDDRITIEVRLAATPPQPDVESLLSSEPSNTTKLEEGAAQPSISVEFCGGDLLLSFGSSQNMDEVLLPRQLINCSLQDRGQYLLSSELGSDCEFLVGKENENKSFRASTIMLARLSPVFERMFFGELRQASPVLVPDVHPGAFYKMLQFAYGCELQLGSQEEIMDLYYVADKYLVSDLQIACLKHVWPTNESNVWSALHMATFYGLPSLLKAALKVMGQKIDAILEHPEFCELTAISLLTIVQAHELKVGSELQLFKAVVRWVSANCHRKGIPADSTTMQAELQDILPYVRFLSMTPEQFAEDPVSSGLLSKEEQLQCLLTIVHPFLHDPPPTICALRKPRGCQSS